MASEKIVFEFTASAWTGGSREIEVRVVMEDNGQPMAELAEEAEEKAFEIAQKKLGTDDIEVVSQGAWDEPR